MRNKDSRIQVIRGILTVFVVLGHAILPSIRTMSVLFKVMFIVIYSFHMFAFFFVSGWVNTLSDISKTKKERFSIYVRKKAKRLIIPFWLFTLFSFGVYLLGGEIPSLSNYLGNEKITIYRIVTALLFDINNVDSHLWFVFQLFFIQIIAELFKEKKRVLFVIVGILNLFPYYTGIYLSSISSIIKYSVPYLGGELFAERYFSNSSENKSEQLSRIMRNKKYTILAALVFSIMNIILFQIDIDSAGRLLISIDRILRIISGCSGTFLIIVLGFKLRNSQLLKNIGNYSYEIYLMHQPFIVNGVGQVLLKFNVWLPIALTMTTVIGILIPFAISELFLKRTTLGRIAIGRQGGKNN